MNRISDTQFQPDWLSMREAADHAARNADLLNRAAACVKPGMRVLDLGSGTGSTARAFTSAGIDALNWCFLDTDENHLRIAKARHPTAECLLHSVAEIDALPLDGVALVTTSALLDLMSANWAEALAARLADAEIPFYAALSFDGRMRWDPIAVADEVVVRAFNRHQRGNKGGHTAMGPDAARLTARAFEIQNFSVELADSSWSLGPDDAPLQIEFVNGVAAAASDAGETQARNWAETKHKSATHSALTVGHQDLLAVPRGMQVKAELEQRR